MDQGTSAPPEPRNCDSTSLYAHHLEEPRPEPSVPENQSASRQPARPKQRPQSRASSSSVHSATTQPNMDQPKLVDPSDPYAGQWMPHDHSNPKEMGPAQAMPSDVMMLQAATHMSNPAQDFTMDGSLGVHMGHQMPYNPHHQQQPQGHPPHQQPNVPRHPLPAEQYTGNGSFTEGDSQMMDVDDDDSMAAIVGAPRPTGARSSANNELEMRQLFGANRHRTLQDVAGELHGDERGPNSERTRQVFAMIWINDVCSHGKGSVPRGRVYAHYASRCATERITVLNPASFGKLVRVLFPGLKTRRLGVRGESKYHYVNFALKDDQSELGATHSQPPKPLPSAAMSASQSFNSASRKSSSASGPGRAAIPSPQTANNPPAAPARGGFKGESFSLYNRPDLGPIDKVHYNGHKTSLKLSLAPPTDAGYLQSEPIALPSIEHYLPLGTDVDAARSLSALYRSHCTSLIDCIRFCREKTFFHLYTSFQGTLTMPVQRLFAKPELAAWIESCDLALYQRMMEIVSGLKLQVLPKQVMTTLRSISDRLVPHIQESFQGQPQHVTKAKEGPATIFAHLLDRALRVNLSAHAAAKMLSNERNRDEMYYDWATLVRIRNIARCVPARAQDDVVNLLVKEMRYLIDPVNVPLEVECMTIYGDTGGRSDRPADGGSGEKGATGSNVLDRWVALLGELSERFPYAPAEKVVECVKELGAEVLQEVTINSGTSFGAWWVTKVWLHEMISFQAENGGFMEMKELRSRDASVGPVPAPAPAPSSEAASQAVDGQKRADGAAEKVDIPANVSQAQPGRAPFPPPNKASQTPVEANGGEAHDDSGIGIRTPEEEFPMDKYTFADGENGGPLAGDDMAAAEAM